ncbi:hypothetical protein IV203_013814 [Nitzschia inconspicua]|uniref:Uncharacterized protein n=1 Tax=Nitzschia inconspicua TaxID=303405 RepID=A0A9K3M5V1_9STRA|nr:hypothetical protein IV203_013814 [Nitzschia inconspicua]
MGMGIIFGLFYVLSGTKYTSLRLTSFDMELQSLKPHDDSGGDVVIINGKPSSSNNNNSTSAVTSTNDCFWYSDNLYHLTCAVLTDRPIQFHVLANRVPKMHRELFQLLDVKRCTNNPQQSQRHKGAGWEDLARNLPQVREKLWHLQEQCQATLMGQSLSSTHTEKEKKKKCLHLARNFNRRLLNCTDTLEQCDRVVFDDSMSFCQLWNIVEDYSTIVSPHGFQLVLPIVAHAALLTNPSNSSLIEVPQRQQQQHQSATITTATSVHIVEVRWLGYGDRSYHELTRIFGINHTLLYGMTPNGKLNTADDNDCVKHMECRKSERKRDIQCTSDTQQQLAKILQLSSKEEFPNSNSINV